MNDDQPRAGAEANTRQWRRAWTHLDAASDQRGATEQKYENFGNATVLGRPGQPAELASI